jgi:hypothetical protein
MVLPRQKTRFDEFTEKVLGYEPEYVIRIPLGKILDRVDRKLAETLHQLDDSLDNEEPRAIAVD